MASRIRWSLSVAILCAAVWVAYWPSLRHLPRSDQIDYLADTLEFQTFRDHYRHSFSYNRTRRIASGDTLLFRPVLFLLLSAETVGLGTNFAVWQAIGILLHLAVVLLLFQMMTEFLGDAAGPPREVLRMPLAALPFFLALFFATSFAVQEMVIWSHIQGYLLFVLLVLASVHLAWRSARGGTAGLPGLRGAPLAACWSLALIATFIHEAGQVLALALAAFVAVFSTSRRALRAGMFLSIPVVYQTLNRIDAVYLHPVREGGGEAFGAVLAQAFTAKTLVHSARFAKFTILQPFFPSTIGTYVRDRLMIGVLPFAGWRLVPLTLLSIALAAAWLVLAVRSVHALTRSGELQRSAPALAAAAVLALVGIGYAAANVLGRMNLRVLPDQLVVNTYYVYLPLAVFLVGSFTLWSAGSRGTTPGGSRVDAAAAVVVVIGLAAVAMQSFPRVRDVNRFLAKSMAPGRELLAAIDRFIAEHESEPRFSVAFDLKRSSAVFGKFDIPITTMLYRKYENNSEPKYVLWTSSDGLRWLPLAEYRRQTGGSPGEQLFPDLVTIRADFNVFAYRGAFYTVPHGTGLFDPDRNPTPARRSDSLDAALALGDRLFSAPARS